MFHDPPLPHDANDTMTHSNGAPQVLINIQNSTISIHITPPIAKWTERLRLPWSIWTGGMLIVKGLVQRIIPVGINNGVALA